MCDCPSMQDWWVWGQCVGYGFNAPTLALDRSLYCEMIFEVHDGGLAFWTIHDFPRFFRDSYRTYIAAVWSLRAERPSTRISSCAEHWSRMYRKRGDFSCDSCLHASTASGRRLFSQGLDLIRGLCSLIRLVNQICNCASPVRTFVWNGWPS